MVITQGQLCTEGLGLQPSQVDIAVMHIFILDWSSTCQALTPISHKLELD